MTPHRTCRISGPAQCQLAGIESFEVDDAPMKERARPKGLWPRSSCPPLFGSCPPRHPLILLLSSSCPSLALLLSSSCPPFVLLLPSSCPPLRSFPLSSSCPSSCHSLLLLLSSPCLASCPPLVLVNLLTVGGSLLRRKADLLKLATVLWLRWRTLCPSLSSC